MSCIRLRAHTHPQHYSLHTHSPTHDVYCSSGYCCRRSARGPAVQPALRRRRVASETPMSAGTKKPMVVCPAELTKASRALQDEALLSLQKITLVARPPERQKYYQGTCKLFCHVSLSFYASWGPSAALLPQHAAGLTCRVANVRKKQRHGGVTRQLQPSVVGTHAWRWQ